MRNIIKTPPLLAIETKSKTKKSFTLVEIMIVVVIIALLSAVAIPGLLRARIVARGTAAKANLKAISTAIESFVATNDGVYPTDEGNLTNPASGPKYLSKPFCNSGTAMNGYVYTCIWGEGYTVNARPTSCDITGVESYNITIGGVLNVDPICITSGG
jgi:prepilin-type N-terminal cleavage/methylation domain-containing protein